MPAVLLTTMVVNSISSQLVELGLSEYEARSYTCLLQCQPATAYEISKASGVPSSKIYEIMNRLVDKGIVRPLSEGGQRGKRYGALDPDEFMAHKRQDITERTVRLAPLLRSLATGREVGYVWPMDSGDAVFDRARRLIDEAERDILISLWPEELVVLKTALKSADQRGVRVAMVHFGPPAERIGATYHHPAEKTIYEEKGGRGFSLIVDGIEVLIATFRKEGAVEAAWSRNGTFVTVAEDYIRHDVYITKVTACLDDELKRKFGKDYEKLRDVFLPVEHA